MVSPGTSEKYPSFMKTGKTCSPVLDLTGLGRMEKATAPDVAGLVMSTVIRYIPFVMTETVGGVTANLTGLRLLRPK